MNGIQIYFTKEETLIAGNFEKKINTRIQMPFSNVKLSKFLKKP